MAYKKTMKGKKTSKNKKGIPQKITRKSSSNSLASLHPKKHLSEEVWNGILGTASFVTAVFFVAAHFGSASWVGEYLVSGTTYLLGSVGYWLVPSLFVVLSYTFFRDLERDFHPMKIVGSIFFLVSGLGTVQLLFEKGGLLGSLLAKLQNPIGFSMALLIMGALFFIALMLIFDGIPFVSSWGVEEDEDEDERYVGKGKLNQEETERINKATGQASPDDQNDEKPDINPKKQILVGAKVQKSTSSSDEDSEMEKSINQKIRETFSGVSGGGNSEKTGQISANSMLPPLSLLSKDKGKPEVGDIKSNANTIKRTLANFGIEVEMGEVEVGPTVTRYAFKPAEGVKLARIAGLKDDLALSLAAKTIRMETPIPGKSLVGIEIPNRNSTMVGFGSLLSSPNFTNTLFTLPLAIGKNIAGDPTFINLAKAPHMLIAGATGAGKSVTVHALINSLLYKHGPDMLKFIMVDPKRVELTLYNGIPHLLTPVITDAKSAILSLKWAVKEMNRRYDVLQEHSVRDIISYHDNITAKFVETDENADKRPERMPYIVVIIDELADIMQAYPRELESGIVQLAQMSRAVGIHLVLSTQRPSVNVITGLIKANIPTRLALQVSSSIDSRTILDMGGAEQLLGKGDMLYMTGEMSKPVRVQCAYLSEEEVKKVVEWIKKQYRGEVPDEIDLSAKAVQDSNVMFAGSIDSDDDDDELYEDAKQAVIDAGKASTSYLQRKLRVGYSRAARLIDMLEEREVIGAADGSKPREVLGGGEEEQQANEEENPLV